MPRLPRRLFKTLSAFLILNSSFFILVSPVLGLSRSDYFDYGPYYTSATKVLGWSFSATEELPQITLPQNLPPLPPAGTTPGNFFYPFERFSENIQLTFTFNPIQKESLRLQLAGERFSEAQTLLSSGNYSQAEIAAVSYHDTLDTFSQNLSSLSQNPSAQNLFQQAEAAAAAQALVTEAVSLQTPTVGSTVLANLAGGSETALDSIADAQGGPSLPKELSQNLTKLQDQGLLTPEQISKLQNLDSRTAVRDELNQLTHSSQFPLAEITKLDTAIAQHYPESYQQTQTVLEFVELRTYQTLPQPSTEIQAKISDWKNEQLAPSERKRVEWVPPPPEIRPYLYYQRAQDLASAINLSAIPPENQTEVAQFFPTAATQNPTYAAPTPTPSPEPADPNASPTPTPIPSPTPPPSQSPTTDLAPFIQPYTGPVPGDFGYFFKRFGEQITFAPPLRLAEERLREAAALAQNEKRQDDYAQALKNYQATLQTAADTAQTGNITAIETLASRHNLIFEKGLLPPPTDQPELVTQATQATENALDKAADLQGQPPLPLPLTDRLQDLKAQGLITPQEVDNLTQSSSRTEVRNELRELLDAGAFPPADAKKLDAAQARLAPQEFNQISEVRKIEELNRLRTIQSEFAQTATLRANTAGLEQRLAYLKTNFDPYLIDPLSLAGKDKDELVKIYDELKDQPRPINSGQFPRSDSEDPERAERVEGPAPTDAVLTSCPAGSIFKPSEGCVWESNGKNINDYEQYRCNLPNQYWSFIANACVKSDPQTPGYRQDTQPQCPPGYEWSWEVSSCTTSTGGRPFPTLPPVPTPAPDETPTCPEGATYQAPTGCVWNENNKPINDPNQYRCNGKENQYYSFSQASCVTWNPDEPMPKDDTTPSCSEPNTYFNWSAGRCTKTPTPYTPPDNAVIIDDPRLSFITPDSPFYFIDQLGETIQTATALSPAARERVRLSHARERFDEAYDLLKRGKETDFKDTLADYTDTMQQVFNGIAKGAKIDGDDLAKQAVRDNLLLQEIAVLGSKDLTTPISAASSVTIQAVDRAADLNGEPPVPPEIVTKLESLPEGMLSPEQTQALLNPDNRLEARLALGELTASGILTTQDTAFLDTPFQNANPEAVIAVSQLKALSEIATTQKQKEELDTKVQKTEEIAQKLSDFQQTFTPGQDIPPDLRPYVRLTQIQEISQTVRPDLVRLEDFGNRKDIQLAVATLQQEFRPTKETYEQVEKFRRNNPNKPLPPELARVEALSYNLGVRDSAGPCFLPSPPFSPNTPCPPSGAPIPVSNYTYASPGSTNYPGVPGFGSFSASSYTPEDSSLTYGQGPAPTQPGSCPDGYHWMYDSGGWCMNNTGTYQGTAPPPTYTPQTPYYGTGGPGSPYSPSPYSPYTYYGTAPTTYTTTPPAGTVPGTGPAPTSPGSCPSGFHWMGDNGGWCMANGGTYTPPGSGTYSGPVTPATSCPGGSYWSSATNNCVYTSSTGTNTYYSPNLTQSSCGPGYYWDGRGCIGTTPQTSTYQSPGYYPGAPIPSCGPGYYWNNGACFPSGSSSGGSTYTSGGSYQSGCAPGNYWNGSQCVAGSYEGSGWSDTAARSTSWCQAPSSGCGSSSYWDYGSCSCRPNSSSTYYPPSGSSGSYTSPGSCGSGYYWNGSGCSPSGSGSYTPPSSSGTSSGGSSSGGISCPGGYHSMGDWCMANDSGSSSGGSTSTSPSPTPTPTESAPAPTPTPAESTPAPAPAESTPAPAPTESTPAPASTPTP